MTTKSLSRGVATGAGALLLGATACTTATPTATPGVEQMGSTVLRYKGPEVDAVLSYRFANLNLGTDWLFLDVAISANGRASVEVKRAKIAVRTPSGEVVPLATQQEFGEAYSQLSSMLARADVAAEPLDYFPSRRQIGLDFLVVPGAGLALESVWVNDQQVAIGRLAFFIPTEVQEGPYELRIDLPESKVRIPFRLGTS